MTVNVFGGGYNPLAPVFPIQRSVRLRSSASAYFARTPASAGNRQIFTFSWWVKRGALSAAQEMYFCNSGAGNFSQLSWAATNTLTIASVDSSVGQCELITTAVYRDPSAWYHVMFAVDTTQATASNRVKIYVNGVQVTAFNTATYPALNYNFQLNNTTAQNIGRPSTGTLDGYLTEFYFIDGQALTPSSFGSYNAGSGVWQPNKYSGTYGTNGFYLNFQDNSGATATTIGKDSSGNGNNWTPNNISVTAGVTYDSMLDVPTNTSPTNANFSVLNPVETNYGTLSNANLSASLAVTGSTGRQARGTFLFPSSGKFYFEVSPSALGVVGQIGVARFSSATNGGNGISPAFSTGDVYLYLSNGQKQDGVTASAYGASFTTSNVIGVAVNVDAGTLTFYKDNVSQGTAYSSLTLSNYYPVVHAAGAVGTASYNVNFGQQPFTYTPPTGFVALNTYNLPTPTIANGANQFAATLYTGTAASLSVSNAVNGKSFQPDFVWVKGRSGATDHALYDAVRGTTKQIESNTTTAETTEATGLTAFGTGGFTVGALAQMNTNAATYVGWQWKASNATAVTNTSGSISSQVSANPTAGFSIVSFNSGAAGNKTVGHGLGVAPSFWIIRSRNAVNNWSVGSRAFGNPQNTFVSLNLTTTATGGDTRIWANAAPTSSVLSFESNYTVVASTDCIAYCFAEIAGYSKFGGFFGNGSADGTFVYLGFRPRYIMYKPTTTAGSWDIRDTSRSTYNTDDLELYANLSNAQASAGVNIDILSNGFKIRNSNATYNGSGVYYIFMAFAENPFSYSLAR